MTEQQTGKAPTSDKPTFPDPGTSAPQQQETLAPKGDKNRKYRGLKPGEFISRCGYILPNALQCWKAGEEEVSEKDAEGIERKYQLCERHAKIQRAIDVGAMKSENYNTVYKEQTAFVPDIPLQDPEPPAKEAPPKVETKKEPEQVPQQEAKK